MENRVPIFSDKHKICIICEGNEEKKYLEKLKALEVWDNQYDITLVDAEGNGNIPARYQEKYQVGSYEIVLVFCDTERKPHEQYVDIKRKINEFHGVENVADKVVIFGNPCTMQIILSHFGKINITSASKSKNAKLIKKYTGIDNYKARIDQIDSLMSFINKENYEYMKENISQLSHDDSVISSTNFNNLLLWIEDSNASWIENINNIIEQDI
jgi:oligoribonuclease NrnB/cAMP/cGMP phosphodiesterase (DHH superfamily)